MLDFLKDTVLPVASSGAGLGFEIGRRSTSLGLGIARTVSSGFVTISSAAVDYSLGLSHPGQGLTAGPTSQLASTLHVLAFDSFEYLAIGGINLGESLAKSQIQAASTVIESINALYGGAEQSSEAAFSLGAFVKLVRRELAADEERDRDQPAYRNGVRPGAVACAKALTAWAAIQAVTPEYGEKRVLSALEPIDMAAWRGAGHSTPREGDDVGIKILQHESVANSNAEIITAEEGHKSESSSGPQLFLPPVRNRLAKDRSYLRRISKIVLGAYGGAGLIFFGAQRPTNQTVSTQAKAHAQDVQDHVLEDTVKASEQATEPTGKLDSWWDTVTGKNDRAIFEHYSKLDVDSGDQEPVPTFTAEEKSYMGADAAMPRFWVLTDHNRKEVVLALRGTMSLNELAIDLTCDPASFVLPSDDSMEPTTYQVHAGFLEIAQAMGGVDKPVHRAVSKALQANAHYSLVIAGHSLGAGVGGLMALMWADPETSLSSVSSGLPPGREVHAYCLACPCIVSAELARLSAPLITTIIYSYDFVSRLSLGSIRDLKRISDWLSYAMDSQNAEGEKCKNLVSRAIKYKAGMGGQNRENEKAWFLSLRKTLEAQMACVHLYPAGEIYHAFERRDFSPKALPSPADGDDAKMILFRVKNIEVDFEQIVFSSAMLSCHLPHQYDRILSNHL